MGGTFTSTCANHCANKWHNGIHRDYRFAAIANGRFLKLAAWPGRLQSLLGHFQARRLHSDAALRPHISWLLLGAMPSGQSLLLGLPSYLSLSSVATVHLF